MNISFLQLASETAEKKEGLAVLGLNPKAFVLQLATWLIFYFLMRKFVFAKVVKMLDERRDVIDKGVDLGHKMEKEKAELDTHVQTELAKARKEADKIIAEAKAQGSTIIKEAEVQATHKVQKMLDDAGAKIEADAERVRKSLRSEMADLVVAATEKIIKQKIDQKSNSDLITKSLLGDK
jgi:F-type H+-transporting ATPase subunit b